MPIFTRRLRLGDLGTAMSSARKAFGYWGESWFSPRVETGLAANPAFNRSPRTTSPEAVSGPQNLQLSAGSDCFCTPGGKEVEMHFAALSPEWLTAMAGIIVAVGQLVWSIRRKASS